MESVRSPNTDTHTSESKRIFQATAIFVDLIQQQLTVKPGNLPSTKLGNKAGRRQEALKAASPFPRCQILLSPVRFALALLTKTPAELTSGT